MHTSSEFIPPKYRKFKFFIIKSAFILCILGIDALVFLLSLFFSIRFTTAFFSYIYYNKEEKHIFCTGDKRIWKRKGLKA